MSIQVTNPTSHPIRFGVVGNGQAFDLIVSTPDEREIWSRMHGRGIPLNLQYRILAPGEVFEFSDEWEQLNNWGESVSTGTYYVRGVLPSDDTEDLKTEPESLTLIP
jgi:hypothetical protein